MAVHHPLALQLPGTLLKKSAGFANAVVHTLTVLPPKDRSEPADIQQARLSSPLA